MQSYVRKLLNVYARLPVGRRGFSLVEVLVAVSILVFAITGPMLLASRSIAQSRYAAEEITAYYLAQEGIEYSHLARDDNFISGANWLHNLTDNPHNCKNGKICTVDASQIDPTNAINTCAQGGSNCAPLYFNATTGFYGEQSGSGWTQSIYTRTLGFTDISSDEELVTCTVTWNEGKISRTFTLTDRLERWYPGS
jgi:prepilin-type N-terminal cleavage/methylation domain-containing protein